MTNSSYRPRSQFYRETDHDNWLEPHPAMKQSSIQMDKFLLNLFARTWDFVEKDTQICHIYGNANREASDVWEPKLATNVNLCLLSFENSRWSHDIGNLARRLRKCC